MGLFSKKPSKNKVYTLKEAMDFINKNPNYSAIETAGGYNLISDEVAKDHISRYKDRYKKHNSFKEEMSGNGAYKNIGVLDYNNQSRTDYMRNTYINSCR